MRGKATIRCLSLTHHRSLATLGIDSFLLYAERSEASPVHQRLRNSFAPHAVNAREGHDSMFVADAPQIPRYARDRLLSTLRRAERGVSGASAASEFFRS